MAALYAQEEVHGMARRYTRKGEEKCEEKMIPTDEPQKCAPSEVGKEARVLRYGNRYTIQAACWPDADQQ